ncbi:MAG: hypothetical protein WKF75_01270 [Singulisphaera sp.]
MPSPPKSPSASPSASFASGRRPGGPPPLHPCPDLFAGIAYRKLGLAGAGPDWVERGPTPSAWGRGRRGGRRLRRLGEGRRSHPDSVLDAALAATDCAGVLVDTWDKTRPNPIARRGGPGSRAPDAAGDGWPWPAASTRPPSPGSPPPPRPLRRRGAACRHGDRLAAVDPDRVALLVRGIVP